MHESICRNTAAWQAAVFQKYSNAALLSLGKKKDKLQNNNRIIDS